MSDRRLRELMRMQQRAMQRVTKLMAAQSKLFRWPPRYPLDAADPRPAQWGETEHE